MSVAYLENLTSRHNDWLTARQTVIAQNIANANTPGYKARDVVAFEAAIDDVRLDLEMTQPGHIRQVREAVARHEIRRETPWETHHSGNDVSVEQELLKSSQIGSAFALNAGVTKAFHRMLMTASKG